MESRTASHPALLESVSVRVERRIAGPPPADYVIGHGDVLYINVFGQPEMGSPQPQGTRILGSRVDGEGRIQLPMIQSVEVAGLTAIQVQRRLQQRFADLIADPWVVVEVVEHRSQPVYLLGEFRNPGVIYLDRPTNLLQGIASGGGLGPEAHLRGARLIHDEQIVAVDIYELLREGALDQNLWLRGGDTIYIPDTRDLKVFVLGNVNSPGAVSMVQGQLNLAQAISEAGGYRQTGGALDRVRIIRSLSPTRGELLVVDLKRVLAGEALPFELHAGDVVFVPRTPLGEWNDALAEIVPTLQAISAALQPFVQLLIIADRN
ncbi:MAG: polysaccharide biosynthesis/export family protein [Phycisphaeraceae bacterium]|nr:polysaccharide biosynthesis/export family protein [Phycisphaeraceae bacterium]